MINLPIFRAKKLGTENDYIEGYLEEHNKSDFYISLMPNKIDAYKIDITTLSIHFPDMLDSQSNKIFASLQEDGKGGDTCSVSDYIYGGSNGVAIYRNYGFRINRKGKATGISLSSTDIKIVGIQQ